MKFSFGQLMASMVLGFLMALSIMTPIYLKNSTNRFIDEAKIMAPIGLEKGYDLCLTDLLTGYPVGPDQRDRYVDQLRINLEEHRK